MHGHGIYDDLSIFAIASVDQVLLMDGKSSSHSMHEVIQNPLPTKRDTVAINWGHGMTPGHMDRPHSMLAISWGPFIQIVVMIDHEDREKPFQFDGYYILRQIRTAMASGPQTSNLEITKAQLMMKAAGIQQVQVSP